MASEKNLPPMFEKLSNSFKQAKVPSFHMERLLSSFQKNMALIASAQKTLAEATQNLVNIQTQHAQKIIQQWDEEMKSSLSKVAQEEKTAHQAETIKKTIDEMTAHLREVNSVIAKSNQQIMESCQARMKEVMEESSELIKKTQKGDK